MICDFCENQSTYKHRSVYLCGECFGYFTQIMFDNWHNWIENGKVGEEPLMWVYNSDNKI